MKFGLAIVALAFAQPASAAAGAPACPWRAAWASSQMIAEGDNALPPGTLSDATLRQTMRPSIGVRILRVRISNAFGRAPLRIAGASVAKAVAAGSGDVHAATLRRLTFAGRAAVVVPAGSEWLSDPVALPARAFEDLAVSLHVVEVPEILTAHPGSRTTSHIVRGDATSAASLAGAVRKDRWYLLAGVEVVNCRARDGIVVLGDSITDGRGSTTNGNDRWTDALAARLAGRRAVINQGIGGNRLLADGLGPNALARLDRDVLAQPGIGHLVVLIGVNDLGTAWREGARAATQRADLVARMIAGYEQVVARARARGLKVHGATILPFMGNDYYAPDASLEADRQAVNTWIRARGSFDSVIDLDAALRDPARPAYLNPAYDTGDRLHPNPAGFRVMADAVRLAVFD